MLRAIANGQSSLHQEMLKGFNTLNKKIDAVDLKLDQKIDRLDEKLTTRIDKLGKQLAYLDDDTPTRQEFDTLDNRVQKLEHKVVTN